MNKVTAQTFQHASREERPMFRDTYDQRLMALARDAVAEAVQSLSSAVDAALSGDIVALEDQLAYASDAARRASSAAVAVQAITGRDLADCFGDVEELLMEQANAAGVEVMKGVAA